MISELRVRELGVIADVELVLEPGLTAITGETGAGKTLIVEALELLLGGRSDASLIRHGAPEARIAGRFEDDGGEAVATRTIAANGRSRASIDDRMVPIAALDAFAAERVDLHGQHAHQSLLRAGAQRRALDEFAGVDLGPVRSLREQLNELDAELSSLGGDGAARARELDVLSFELAEIAAAGITAADEDATLEREEAALGMANALRAACEAAYAAIEGDDAPGAADRLGTAIEALQRLEPLAEITERVRSVGAELAEAAAALRRLAEGFEEDPARLEEVRARRQLFHRLVRKYGSSLDDVLAAERAGRERLAELASSDARRDALEARRASLLDELAAAERVVGAQRRSAAATLGPAVEAHLAELALASARVRVEVGEGDFGDDVQFLLAANLGEPFLQLSRVASGGELARVMLALRLVLSSAPPTLVFDEVDAGIGGEAALAVGRALARLGREHQVLVVTHLAQVAAFADHQFVVEKAEADGRTVSTCRPVEGEARVVELSRMLSGQPTSDAARRHAADLLAEAERLVGECSPTIRHGASRAL